MRVDYKKLKTIANICGDNFDIRFSSDKIYIRFSYWKKLSDIEQYLLRKADIELEENEYEDDECGYLYSYTI